MKNQLLCLLGFHQWSEWEQGDECRYKQCLRDGCIGRLWLFDEPKPQKPTRADRIFQAIENACVNHITRIFEVGFALSLIGLATYILDERVVEHGMVAQPMNIPYKICGAIFISTGILQLIGVLMPLIHAKLKARGVRGRWLSQAWFSERVWRMIMLLLGAALWCMYASLISGASLAGWIFAGVFVYLQTAEFIRLGAAVSARSTSDKLADGDAQRDRRDGNGPHDAHMANLQNQSQHAFSAGD